MDYSGLVEVADCERRLEGKTTLLPGTPFNASNQVDFMYEVKSRIYLEFTKTQKSALCNFLRALTKKLPDFGVDKILAKFIEDEQYYFEINSPHFEFLKDFLDDGKFISDTKLFIKECIKYYDYKKSQAPLIQAQKEFEKKKRKFLQEVKMSKESPTKKQISYYNSLCKRYSENKKDVNELSKLDLRNEIDRIISERQGN